MSVNKNIKRPAKFKNTRGLDIYREQKDAALYSNGQLQRTKIKQGRV